MDSPTATLIVGGAGMITTVLAWLWGDAKNKARTQFLEEKVKVLTNKYDAMYKEYSDSKSSMEQRLATGEQVSKQIHENVDKLDDNKASKEMVGMFKDDIQLIRQDIDRRFDKLERMIERITSKE